jgi:predicted Zn-dependent protease
MKTRLLFLFSLFLVIGTCSTSPTGRKQIAFMSDSKMNTMGAEAFEEIKKQEKISKNQQANDYVQCIANNITKNVSKKVHAGDWEVVVFESEQINAFALPGGKIGVYTGLMKVTENQDQLAAVMGHEVAHVIAGHSNERMSSGSLTQVGLTALDLVLGANQVAGKDAIVQGTGVLAQYGILMPYGRSHESEADIIGQDLMAKSGFEPKASVDLWHNMAKNSKGAPPEFMSTHPSHDTRIKQLSSHLKKSTPMYQQSAQKPACIKPKTL